MTDKNTNDTTHQPEEKSYESSISELEDILQQLENNSLPLQDAIKNFEAGVALIKHCQSILDTTEQKIKGLMDDPDGTDNALTATEGEDIFF